MTTSRSGRSRLPANVPRCLSAGCPPSRHSATSRHRAFTHAEPETTVERARGASRPCRRWAAARGPGPRCPRASTLLPRRAGPRGWDSHSACRRGLQAHSHAEKRSPLEDSAVRDGRAAALRRPRGGQLGSCRPTLADPCTSAAGPTAGLKAAPHESRCRPTRPPVRRIAPPACDGTP